MALLELTFFDRDLYAPLIFAFKIQLLYVAIGGIESNLFKWTMSPLKSIQNK